MKPPFSRLHALLSQSVISLTVSLLFAGSLVGAAIVVEGSTAHAFTLQVSARNVREQSFWSPSLGRRMPYAIYLPPGYGSDPHRRYPVLYMLHGLGGDHDTWLRDGLFAVATDLIQSGAIAPLIIVAPEGERGYWMDHATKGPRYGSYVANDLVRYIDRKYHTITSRQGRAIGGMSMGGHGALQLALRHPDEFAVVGAHSVALRRHDQAFSFFGDKAYFESNDPVSLCAKNQAAARSLAIWLDIGSADPWYQPAAAFDQQLQSSDVPHLWHVYPGGHNDAYWTAHAADYLRYYSQALSTRLAAPMSAQG